MRWFRVILGISIASVFRASALKPILDSTESGSWMSKKNLTTLLEVSFDKPICCNVLIAGDSPVITNVFNNFVKVYPHAYTSNNKTLDCPDYFLISGSVDGLVTLMKTVPSTIASVRLLIVFIGDNVEESSDLFKVSMYQDASAVIAALNGFWTLSENILNSRVFKKVFGFDEMAYKRQFVDFQGREIQAVTLFSPPFSYLRSTVNRTHNGISAEFYTLDDQSELDGIEIQLFVLMARRLNFTWTMRQGDRIDWFGKRNGSGWSGGIVGQIYRKEVDVAFAGMFITLDRYEVINLTQPWVQSFSTFAVPRPKPHRNIFALITPLSKEVWAAILAMLIMQSAYISGRAWIDPRISMRFRNFVVTLTELMGQLLGMWTPPRIQGLRLQLHLWRLSGILLITAYSSNLAARLSREFYENKIDTTQDFADSTLTWGSRDLPAFELILDVSNPHENEIRKRFEFEASEDETREKILKGNYAIIGSVIDTMFFPRNDVNDKDLKNFRVMDSAISSQYMGFSVQPWLLGPLNMMIVQLRESGLVQYHIDNVVQRHVGRTQRELTVDNADDDEGPKVLNLTCLGVGFCILILGLSLSTIIFFLELKYFSKELSPGQVLRQIKKNRETWRIKELRRKRRYPFFGPF